MSMGSFGLKSDLFHFRHNRFLKQVSYTCFLLLFLLLLAAPVSIANALQPVGTRYVTTTGSDASVDCSLAAPCRTVQHAADVATSGDTISIGAGTFGTVDMSFKGLTLTGAGMNATYLDGGNVATVVTGGYATYNISDLTIQNGRSSTYAAGVYLSNQATLTMDRVRITSNTGTGDAVGGLYAANSIVTLNDSIISNNTSSLGTGIKILQVGGTSNLTLNRVTMSGNNATTDIAAIYFSGTTLSITNSTISGNTSPLTSAISLSGGTATVLNSTISHNTSTGSPGDKAIVVSGGATLNFKNSIVSNGSGNCRVPYGTITSQGNNLESGVSCNFIAAGDLTNTDPLLGSLADNGGLTQTRALLTGSPAINAGTNTGCPSIDQRGYTRPQGTSCDMGAYEVLAAGAFNKTSPADDAVNQPAWLNLTWEASEHASYYEYCMDTCSTWYYVGSDPYLSLGPLTQNITYSWQVRAHNDAGYTYANGTTDLWSFTTGMVPAAFSKTSPTNGAVNLVNTPTLTWGASTGATSYEYCISDTGECSAWVDNGTSTSITLPPLDWGTTYHWQVRARSNWGDTIADGSTQWTFTTTTLPQITSINPTSKQAGSPDFYLFVNGSHFVSGDLVRWDGSSLTTSFINSTQLRATVPAAKVLNAGAADIDVVRPALETYPSNKLQIKIYTFADVLPSHPLWRYVEGFFGAEITTGCAINPLKYCPDRNVTRGEMAVFVLRAIHKDALPYTPTPSTTGIFADVPTPGKDWMQPWIEEFYEIGITTGCAAGPLRYCPERYVTRGEMAVFLLRAMHKDELPYIPNPEPDTVGIFADVPASNWMKPWIEEFYDEEITTGCGTSGDKLLYCPNRNVTRAEMATFIDRAFDIAQIP